MGRRTPSSIRRRRTEFPNKSKLGVSRHIPHWDGNVSRRIAWRARGTIIFMPPGLVFITIASSAYIQEDDLTAVSVRSCASYDERGNRRLARWPSSQSVGFPGLLVRFSTLLFARTLP